jgi:hypothetical protein
MKIVTGHGSLARPGVEFYILISILINFLLDSKNCKKIDCYEESLEQTNFILS